MIFFHIPSLYFFRIPMGSMVNSTLSSDHILIKVRDFAKNFYDETDDLHGWGHIIRVLKLTEKIAKYYPVDSQTLEMGVILHDIGRKGEKIQNRPHAELSAEIATSFMHSLQLDNRIISDVVHIILSHSFSLKISPESIEAKILSDADKLDA
ncbi:MAG: HD domain-containing protein, partial [Promethearchaeota archaeon]